MSKLELQQIKCPNCQSNVTTFGRFEGEVECPFCHQRAFNPTVTTKKVTTPDSIIPFKVDEKHFRQAMIEALIETDLVPTNILNIINPSSITKAYLPIYLYEGTFRAEWSGFTTYKQKIAHVSSDGKSVNNQSVTRHRTVNGVSSNTFSLFSIAYDGNDVPKELKCFADSFPLTLEMMREYNSQYHDGSVTYTLAADSNSSAIWGKRAQPRVEQIANDFISQQLSPQRVEDLSVTSTEQLIGEGRYIFAPIWFIYYMYNDTPFYFFMDGVGVNQTLSTPVDQEQVKVVQKYAKIKLLMGLLCLLSLPCFYFGYKVALIVAGVTILAKIITNYVVNRKLKKFFDVKRNERRNAANEAE